MTAAPSGEAPGPDPPDPRTEGVWPRVCLPSRSARRAWTIIGAVCLLIGLGFIGSAPFLTPRPNTLTPTVILALFGLAVALGGLYCVVAIRRERLLIHEDAIELRSFGRRPRRLHRDEIAGFRYDFRSGFTLEPNDPKQRPISISEIDIDPAVVPAWLTGPLPNLDARDQEQAEAELLQRPDLGGTEEERSRLLGKLRTRAHAATVATVAVGAWAQFYPRPYRIAVGALILIPLLTLAQLLARPGCYVTTERKNDPRPWLAIPLFGPGIILAVRALIDGQEVIDWVPPLLGAVLGALVLGGLVALGDPVLQRRRLDLLGVMLFLGAYPWAMIQHANAAFDRSLPARYQVEVTEKHRSSKNGHHLRLAPWGPKAADEIAVGKALYDSVEVGSTVCVQLRSGALGVRWFKVASCDGQRR